MRKMKKCHFPPQMSQIRLHSHPGWRNLCVPVNVFFGAYEVNMLAEWLSESGLQTGLRRSIQGGGLAFGSEFRPTIQILLN